VLRVDHHVLPLVVVVELVRQVIKEVLIVEHLELET
jgi:hypothetical protein